MCRIVQPLSPMCAFGYIVASEVFIILPQNISWRWYTVAKLELSPQAMRASGGRAKRSLKTSIRRGRNSSFCSLCPSLP